MATPARFHQRFRASSGTLHQHSSHSPDTPKRRRGGIAFELLVSGTLLLTLMAFVAPLSVRCGRIWQEARSYRLAASELTSQLERLTLLSDAEIQAALEQWQPEPDLSTVLPGVTLTGQLLKDNDGSRLRLEIDWPRGPGAQPLVLIGWRINPNSSPQADQ